MEHLLSQWPRTSSDALGEKAVNCPDHGFFVATGMRYAIGKMTKEIWTTCPACEEARLAAQRQADAIAKAEAMRAQLEGMLSEAAIPARFIGRTLENFHASSPAQRVALQAAKDFTENFDVAVKRGNGLIFSGLPGTGKSHLATAVLQAIMPAHCGLYVTCIGLIRAVRATWRRDSERSEKEVLDLFCGVPLLVLDEIGVQYGTDGEQTILFDVLDRRYRDLKPSILLTNQDKAGFKQYIGERVFDRLTETSKWVAFDWQSYRATARREAA